MFKPSARLLRSSLNSHSRLGLFLAAALYLVSLTGVISIYYPELERWEQADAPEFASLSPERVQTAIDDYLTQYPIDIKAGTDTNLWVSLPSTDMPRMSLGIGEHQYQVNADGHLGAAVSHEWTHFLTDLHYALTIPGVWGLTLVGILGVLLITLLMSGLLAHPGLIRNAFTLRLNKGYRQRQADFHNRLGVWSTPFILIIAVTGALIGLSQVLLLVFSLGFFKGDTNAIAKDLYFPPTESSHEAAPLMNVADVLHQMQTGYPQLAVTSLYLRHPMTTSQTLEVGTFLPDRLVWYEAFHFDRQGKLIRKLGWSDGPLGTQIYASTYRLHFGHFGGLPVKILYTLLGLGLCFICATGMNIWFRRQAQQGAAQPVLERLWVAVVWGFPLALAVTAIADFWWEAFSTALFWSTSAALFCVSYRFADRHTSSFWLRIALMMSLLLLLIIHLAHFGPSSFQRGSLLINAGLLLTIALLAAGLWLPAKRQPDLTITPAIHPGH